MLAILEFSDVFAYGRSADAGMALDIHVVTQCEHDGLDLGCEFAGGGEDEGLCFADGDIDGLEDGDGKGCGFTGTGLGLGNDVAALCDGENGALLDGGGFFKV